MLKLYKFHKNYYRHGELEGLFIEESDLVDKLIELEVDVTYYDILGKHSEVTIKFDKDTFAVLLDDPKVVDILVEHIGYSLSGINPIDKYTDKYIEVLDGTCEYDSDVKAIHDELKSLGFI